MFQKTPTQFYFWSQRGPTPAKQSQKHKLCWALFLLWERSCSHIL